jgi:hypothetical protein
MLTLAAAASELLRLGSKPAASLATSLAMNKTWALRAAREAFALVPPPRPRRALASWLRAPETLRDVLLAPGRPTDDVVRDVDDALTERSRRWRRLPAEIRLDRAETVTVAVYSSALAAQSPSRAVAIASARDQSAHKQTQDAVNVLGEGIEQILQRLGDAQAGGDRERLESRLRILPAAHHDAIRRAWEDAPAPTWTLVTALTSTERRPQDVVADWAASRPAWLSSAPPEVQAVAAHLAAAYGEPPAARELFLAAARAGAQRRQYLIARAALLLDPPQYDDALALLEAAGTPEQSPEPVVRALHAVVGDDWDRARSELAAWTPDDPVGWSTWLVLQIRVAFLSSGGGGVTTIAMFDEALSAARKVLEAGWNNTAAVQAARFLLHRAVRGGSPAAVADLREALDLAVRTRDDIRTWRGDTTQAVALACQIALHSDDPRRVVVLGAEQATPEEASSAEVALHVAVARLTLREPVDEADIRRLTPYGQATVRALMARRDGNDPAPHWRDAIAAAVEDTDRVTALAGLAGTGEAAHPTLDDLDAEFPQTGSLIRARAELASGNPRAAIARLRGNTAGSAPAALVLAEAYERAGETDNAVATLRETAAETSDPEYALSALRVLWAAGRKDEIPPALTDLLSTAPPGWAGRPAALQMAAQLAADARDLPRAADLLRASLSQDPHDPDTRWALARILAIRGDLPAAAAELAAHPRPLEPATVDQAHLWLELNKNALAAPELVEQILGLLDRFPDSEKLAAHALIVLVSSRREPGDLPADLLARVRELHVQFFDRWPDSEHFTRYTVDDKDAEATLAQLAELVSVPPDVARARRQFQGRIARTELPLGALSSAVGRGYAELLLRRGVLGALPAWHPDPTEHVAAKEQAAKALGGTTLMDSSVGVSLSTLAPTTRAALTGAFRRVEVVDEALVDARATRDSLAMRSTGTLTFDDRTQQPRFEEISQEEANRLADAAEDLLTTLTALPRVPSAPLGPDEDDRLDDRNPWMPACRTAAANGTALWSDDAALRVLARAMGANAFSTWALVEVLTDRGDLSSDAHDTALSDLVAGRVAGGLPLAAPALLAIAEREEWRAGGAALVLGSPGLWREPQRATPLLAAVVPAVVQHRPDALPAWVYRAATGIGYAHPDPAASTVVAAGMLAITINNAGSRPDAVRDLVQATRAGLADAAADPAHNPDPLQEAADLLFKSLSDLLTPAIAAQYVSALFSELDPADRATVAKTLLT